MTEITKEMIDKGVDKQQIEGLCLVQTYKTDKTKNGDNYINGNLMVKGIVPFKVWNNSSAYSEFANYEYKGQVVNIVGTINVFNGQKSIIISSVTAINDVPAENFLEEKYDMNYYFDLYTKLLQKKCSPTGMELMQKFILGNQELINRFKIEFAASSHHDNCKSGLLAHTVKVVNNMAYIINMYPDLVKGNDDKATQNNIDLLMIGSAVHDIGKIDELHLGGYTSRSRVTHRILGLEYIFPYKDWIVEKYGMEWYDNLCSIIVQHHDEFDDKARTVWAYLVHKADLLDAEMTLVQQLKAESDGTKIKVDGRYLEF